MAYTLYTNEEGCEGQWFSVIVTQLMSWAFCFGPWFGVDSIYFLKLLQMHNTGCILRTYSSTV